MRLCSQRYDHTIAADHRPGTPVVRVAAHDRDSGPNSVIQYSLLGAPRDTHYFALDRDTGVLSLDKSIEEFLVRNTTFTNNKIIITIDE